jgi:hypothetical protein
MSWVVVAILVIFLIIWMSLTFTNQLCTGMVGFGLCFKSPDDPACPVCPPAAAPAAVVMTPAALGPTGKSNYEMEPYSK